MNEDVLTQYPKECLLEVKQTLVHVGDSLKKPTTRDKTKPVGFQRVGPKNEQLGVTWLGHLIVPSRMGKCQSQHVLLHLEK
jgi:hypothetical protein